MIKIYKRNYLLTFYITILLVLLLQGTTLAQSAADSVNPCPIKSVPDLFKKKDSSHIIKPIKNSFFILIPVIGSQPATGFSYGAIAQYTFKGKKPEDKYSSMSVGANYTTKHQVL